MKTSVKKTKFVFITGGVISGIGKGITAASIGRLLISRGYTVIPIKTDPYLNEDAGTMNPMQHGEVFVTKDGAETDLDLGHYERFMSIELDKRSNFTSGAVFRAVLDKERNGDFLGRTIQIVPHITDEIQKRIIKVADKENPDFILVEIGGTLGADIEIQPFAEAMRQLAIKVGKERFASIHVVKMDYVFPSDEAKTKPIQHSVRAMMGLGLSPDILIVRAKRQIEKSNLEKISLFCSVPMNRVIPTVDSKNIYEIPPDFDKKGLASELLGIFKLPPGKKDFILWKKRLSGNRNAKKTVKVGIIGKYHEHPDAYISVNEAIFHAAAKNGIKVKPIPIDSEAPDMKKKVLEMDGIIVPGGYGKRGIDGMIKGIKIVRENKIPFLGLCYGMQMAIIERARNVIGWKDANTTEIDPETAHPVVDILENQKGIGKMGGSQRLGNYPAVLRKGSLIYDIYSKGGKFKGTAVERHRHRYEVNPSYHGKMEDSGLKISGKSPDGALAEFIELDIKDHPFFLATQAHPEFKSSFLFPHPVFDAFIKATIQRARQFAKKTSRQ